MKITASEICDIIKGDLIGDPSVIISSFSNIRNSKKGDITFLSDMRYKKHLQSTKASLIIVPHIEVETKKTIIKTENPAQKFAEILNIFLPKRKYYDQIATTSNIHVKSKIGSKVIIGENVIISKNVSISDNCIINPNTIINPNCTIGENTEIGPNVTIYENTEIGDNCIIHAGAVIGSDGFGFIPTKEKLVKMPQIGKVIIKNNVEVGANTTIDRGTFDNTIIQDGVKLDNLIQIGHNVTIGSNTVIAAQTGIAGSTKIGNNCMIGGQVAIADHIKIGNNVKIAGKSGVIKNITNGKIIQGPLAFEIKEFQKSYIYFKKLPEIVEEIKKLKK
tara:strand:+ start:372 stop:1370 length:999 start_codon:yes stop_codon:yes gene_type:complete